MCIRDRINYRAMKALPRGGYLATCSCSHFMADGRFRGMLKSAAADAGVELRLIEARQQGPDHPVLWNEMCIRDREGIVWHAVCRRRKGTN